MKSVVKNKEQFERTIYESNGKIYFGEFTFFPGNGDECFDPLEWDYILGSWIKL